MTTTGEHIPGQGGTTAVAAICDLWLLLLLLHLLLLLKALLSTSPVMVQTLGQSHHSLVLLLLTTNKTAAPTIVVITRLLLLLITVLQRGRWQCDHFPTTLAERDLCTLSTAASVNLHGIRTDMR